MDYGLITMDSLYIHIPFCQSRCIYCDFYSTTLGQDVMASYVDALEREMHLRRRPECLADQQYNKCTRVHTIYIGGGTPSLLPVALLHRLFEAIDRNFTIDEGAEVTIEANPDDVTREWVRGLEGTPVNRVSMGAQTFNDKLLGTIGRRHDSRQTIDAVENLKAAGIDNISLDLIYGLPGQTMDDWRRDVECALSLGIKHLSAYALSVEPGTPLDSSPLKKGLEGGCYEELTLRMYDHLMSETDKAGFRHYEISNFALPGFHSRHNSSYWQGVPYIGLGAGAHSYDGKRTRRANLPDIKAYIEKLNGQCSMENAQDAPHETEELSDDNLYNEFIMTRLRTSLGIPLEELSEENRRYCLSMAEPHLRHNLLHIKNEHLCLTKEGIFTSNDIISDLLKVDFN